MRFNRTHKRRDDGSVLLIVLVLCVVLGLVVIGLATYSTGTLRYGQVAEASADRLAAAQGAMDNALEEIDRGSSPCTLTALAGGSGGYTYQLGDQINGITPTINCQSVGGKVHAVDAFAVIITGDGAGRTGPMLTITNGGNSAQAEKIFEGPVYLAGTPRYTAPNVTMNFNATLTIKNGDLWYSRAAGCPAPDIDLPSQLTISPAGYTTKCLPDTWNNLFQSKRPPEPDVTNTAKFQPRSSTNSSPINGCYVWQPGAYSAPPHLVNNSYNYFKSGNYFFNFPDLPGVRTWSVDNAFVLMGAPGPNGPGIPGPNPQDRFDNNVCRSAWEQDADQLGAAVYLGAESNVVVDQNGTFEVSGRLDPSFSPYKVSIQAMEDTATSTRRGDEPILATGSGSNKQLAIHGLVWAPYAAFNFDLISNEAVAALTGGAVVGELSAGASANANNFVISVETQPVRVDFLITATAANAGRTTVESRINYRTDTEFALLSRRIVGLTPE